MICHQACCSENTCKKLNVFDYQQSATDDMPPDLLRELNFIRSTTDDLPPDLLPSNTPTATDDMPPDSLLTNCSSTIRIIFHKPTTDDMPPGLLLRKYLQEKRLLLHCLMVLCCSQPLLEKWIFEKMKILKFRKKTSVWGIRIFHIRIFIPKKCKVNLIRKLSVGMWHP